jgi:hypothetical protein
MDYMRLEFSDGVGNDIEKRSSQINVAVRRHGALSVSQEVRHRERMVPNNFYPAIAVPHVGATYQAQDTVSKLGKVQRNIQQMGLDSP